MFLDAYVRIRLRHPLLLYLAFVLSVAPLPTASFLAFRPSGVSPAEHVLSVKNYNLILEQHQHSSLVFRGGNRFRSCITTTASTATSVDTRPDDDGIIGKVEIVYCTGCRWMLRSAYFAQELLTTFEEDLHSVTLVPSRPPFPGGTFLVTIDGALIWDRKTEGRFPETKELKQRVRDSISPDKDLGHSDVAPPAEVPVESKQITVEGEKCDECPEEDDSAEEGEPGTPIHATPRDVLLSPHAVISYCVGCKWMFRAAWYAQELLTTFQDDINSVSLVPSRPPSVAGQFTVTLDDNLIWDRKTEGRHAEAKELKQRIRDAVVPDRDLGQIDVVEGDEDQPVEEDMGEDDAADLRNFYGVM